MNMAVFLSVRLPPAECEALSSPPRYASVSTILPLSSVPSAHLRTNTCRDQEQDRLDVIKMSHLDD